MPGTCAWRSWADTKGGPFDVPGGLAREWLREPANPNGRPNSDVLKPWMNGMAITRRSADKWIVDFGWTMEEGDAALYESPFQQAQEYVYRCGRGTGSRSTVRIGGDTFDRGRRCGRHSMGWRGTS